MQTIRPDATTTQVPLASGIQRPAVNGQTTVHGCMTGIIPVSTDFTECIAGSLGGDVLVVGLGDPGNTPNHDRNHIIRVVATKNTADGAKLNFICELRQSYVSETDLGTLITSFVCEALPSSMNTFYRYRLPTADAALITDYTALSLRFITANGKGGAPRSHRLHWAELQLPENTESNVVDLVLSPEEARRKLLGKALTQAVDKKTIGSTAPF